MLRFKYAIVVAGAATAAALTLATVGVGAAGAAGAASSPPNGVYTCAWIAANPVAAEQASVGCGPNAPAIVAGMLAPTFLPAPHAAVGATPLTGGESCQRVPASGQIGQGVFAWTPSYYTSYQWVAANNGYANPDYTWYVQKTNGTNAYSHEETDWTDRTSPTLTATSYRGGVQNHSATASAFSLCYLYH